MLENENLVECPGCGLKLSNHHINLFGSYNASVECYQKYSDLSSYTIGKRDIDFIHQHAVDTYSAQHSGNNTKSITTVFSLIGLYYAIEKGFSGRQVQRVHTLLSHQKYTWKELQPPDKSVYSITVLDVLNQPSGESRDKMIRKWMIDVWECWVHQHIWVEETCYSLLK